MLYLELIIRPTTDDLLQIFDRERWVLYLSCNYMECYFNPIRSGGGALKAPPPPPPIFCSHAFNFGAALLCVGDFSPKISQNTVWRKTILIGGHDLAVRGVSKYKVDMIFVIFCEFNTMLEIVDS